MDRPVHDRERDQQDTEEALELVELPSDGLALSTCVVRRRWRGSLILRRRASCGSYPASLAASYTTISIPF